MSAYIAFETTRCELLTIIESATVEQSRSGVDKKSPTLRWPALAGRISPEPASYALLST